MGPRLMAFQGFHNPPTFFSSRKVHSFLTSFTSLRKKTFGYQINLLAENKKIFHVDYVTIIKSRVPQSPIMNKKVCCPQSGSHTIHAFGTTPMILVVGNYRSLSNESKAHVIILCSKSLFRDFDPQFPPNVRGEKYY